MVSIQRCIMRLHIISASPFVPCIQVWVCGTLPRGNPKTFDLGMRVAIMQINPRTSLAFCVKAIVIVCCWVVSFYATFFGFQSFTVRKHPRPKQPAQLCDHPSGSHQAISSHMCMQ